MKPVDQPRGEAEGTAERDHRPGPRFGRAVLGDDRGFGVIGEFGAAGIDVGAVFEDPLQAFELGLSIVRRELGRLSDGGVGRRQINFWPEEPVARRQRFERRPIGVGPGAEANDELGGGHVRRGACLASRKYQHAIAGAVRRTRDLGVHIRVRDEPTFAAADDLAVAGIEWHRQSHLRFLLARCDGWLEVSGVVDFPLRVFARGFVASRSSGSAGPRTARPAEQSR